MGPWIPVAALPPLPAVPKAAAVGVDRPLGREFPSAAAVAAAVGVEALAAAAAAVLAVSPPLEYSFATRSEAFQSMLMAVKLTLRSACMSSMDALGWAGLACSLHTLETKAGSKALLMQSVCNFLWVC